MVETDRPQVQDQAFQPIQAAAAAAAAAEATLSPS
jgi:hypothetical protein